MSTKKNNNLFTNLSDLGFTDLENISLYVEEETKEKKSKDTTSNIEDNLFDRKTVCPVCGENITIRSVKSSSIRTISKDTDFMPYYKDPNPLFYDAWVCTNCGYSALSNQFNKITDKQIRLIKENICSKWSNNHQYPSVYTVDTALQMYQLALLNSIMKQVKTSEKAIICLKLSWLYRIKQDKNNENKFMQEALNGYIKAIQVENFPISGLDDGSLTYLIGELYRKLDNEDDALLWYGKVIFNKTSKQRIKNMALDQKDLIIIKKKKKVEESQINDIKTISNPKEQLNNNNSSKKGFLEKLFNAK